MEAALRADEAQAQIAQDDHRRALDALREEQRKTKAAKSRSKKAQARLDKAVALAVSTRPKAENWYEYPGPLNRDEVRGAVGLSKEDLPALMKRYRKRVSS